MVDFAKRNGTHPNKYLTLPIRKTLKNKVLNFLIFNKRIFIRTIALILMIPLIISTVSIVFFTTMFVFSENVYFDIHSDRELPYFIELFINLSKWDIIVVLVLIITGLIYLTRLSLILFKEERLVLNRKGLLIVGLLLIFGISKVTLFRSEDSMVYEQNKNVNIESQTFTLDSDYREIFLELEHNANKRRTIPFGQVGDYIYLKIKRKYQSENIQIKLKIISKGTDKTKLSYPLRIVNNIIYLPNFLTSKRRGNWTEKKVELEIYLPQGVNFQIGDELYSDSKFMFVRE